MALVSILIPAFNEEKTISEIIGKVFEIDVGAGDEKEVVVVDDASVDNTAHEVERALEGQRGRLIKHDQNMGKGAAVRTALNDARGDVVIVQDADLEYDPSDIVKCVRPIIEGSVDVVYGSRRLNRENTEHSSWFFFAGGVLVTQVFNLLYGQRLTDEPTCYKAFRRKVLTELGFVSDGFEWEPEVTAKLARAGVEIAEVPISYNPRVRSEGKKITWLDGVKAISVLVRIRFQRH